MERGECRRVSLCRHWKRICAVTCLKIADVSEGCRRLRRLPTPQKFAGASETVVISSDTLFFGMRKIGVGPEKIIIGPEKIAVGSWKFIVAGKKISTAACLCST